MKWLRKLSMSKAEKEFERAMSNGDWSMAAQIAQAEALPDGKLQRANRSSVVCENIRQYSHNADSKQRIDNILTAAIDPIVQEKVTSNNRSMLLKGLSRKALIEGKTDEAIRLASRIEDKEMRALSMRRVACYLSIVPGSLDKMVAAISQMPIVGYQSEDLRDLSLAQIILGNPLQALAVAEKIPDLGLRTLVVPLARYFIDHAEISEQKNRAEDASEPAERLMKLALIAARLGDQNSVAQSLQSMNPGNRDAIISNFAKAQAYAGKLDQALETIHSIKQKSKMFLYAGFLLGNYPYSLETALATLREASRQGCETISILYIDLIDIVLAGQVADVIRVIEENENTEMNTLFFTSITNLLTEVSEAKNIQA